MTKPDQNSERQTGSDTLPPIRRPILFYASATLAYGFLAGAVLALILI